jgi:two-component system sensor histidine kinase ChiS
MVSLALLYFIVSSPALPDLKQRRCRIGAASSVLASALGLCFPFMPAGRFVPLAGSLAQCLGFLGFQVSLVMFLLMGYFPGWGFRQLFPLPLLALTVILLPITGVLNVSHSLGAFSLTLFALCSALLVLAKKGSRQWKPFLSGAGLCCILGLSFVLPLGFAAFFWPAGLLGYLFFEYRLFSDAPKSPLLFLPAAEETIQKKTAGKRSARKRPPADAVEPKKGKKARKAAVPVPAPEGAPPVDIPVDISQLQVSSFIPKEFLAILNKNSVEELKLGDHIKQEMTIFFSDIRQFTELSENLTPEESFAFINSYLSRIVPEISKNGGFVDKYIGDAILALYPQNNGPDMAVKTAISIQERIQEYNTHRAKCGYRPLAMGIGIHTGTLMVGVVGTKDRMQSTVISDAVNLASRVESLTKAFRISLAISEETFKKLEDPGSYKYRFVAKVRVKGKNEPVSIFEIFDGIDPGLQERKIEANRYFEQGMLDYYQKHFAEALAGFRRVLAIIPDDGASAFYMDNCLTKLKPAGLGEK